MGCPWWCCWCCLGKQRRALRREARDQKRKDDGRKRAQRQEVKDQKQRNDDRKQQENKEQSEVVKEVKEFCNWVEIREKYSLEDECPMNIGGRLQKYWFMLREMGSDETATPEAEAPHALLSISPLSNRCPIKLDDEKVKDLNNILQKVQRHPYVHSVRGIWLLPMSSEGDRKQAKILVVRKFHEKGSLRDHIYNNVPYYRSRLVSWSKKYADQSATSLDVREITQFGKQILKAIKFLHDCGIHTLGHIHTGNIYLEEVPAEEGSRLVCKLGGCSEMLLGYRTRLYMEIVQRNLLKHIDIILFGHVIFEMGSGRSPSEVIPTEEDYKKVPNEAVRKILKFIFNLENSSFRKIRKQPFFKTEKLPEDLTKVKVKVSSSERFVLDEVDVPYQEAGKETSPPGLWRKFTTWLSTPLIESMRGRSASRASRRSHGSSIGNIELVTSSSKKPKTDNPELAEPLLPPK